MPGILKDMKEAYESMPADTDASQLTEIAQGLPKMLYLQMFKGVK